MERKKLTQLKKELSEKETLTQQLMEENKLLKERYLSVLRSYTAMLDSDFQPLQNISLNKN